MSPKIRVYELSKALDLSNREVMTLLSKEFDVAVKSHSSSIDQSVATKLTAMVKDGKSGKSGKSSEGNQEIKKNTRLQTATAVAEKKTPHAAPSNESDEDRPRIKLRKRVKVPPPEPETPTEVTAEATEVTTEVAPEKAEPPTPSVPYNGDIIDPVERQARLKKQREEAAQQSLASEKEDTVESPEAEKINVVEKKSAIKTLEQPKGPKQMEPSAQGKAPRKLESAPQPVKTPQAPASDSKHAPPKQPPKVAAEAQPSDGYKPGQRRKSTVPPHMRKKVSKEGHLALLKKGAHKSKPEEKKEEEPVEELPKIVTIDGKLTVTQLAELLQTRETEIIKTVFMKGVVVTVNQTLDPEFSKTIARELEFEVLEPEEKDGKAEYSSTEALEKKGKLDSKKYKNQTKRSPVISIMGHVDHGKTSLLDAIRETRHQIVDTEAGGITQSIGAYTVKKGDEKIVFLDTPGHEAFTAMRMRGAKSTDIAILVVAADDGVMPQTIEAINHAKAAEIPIIIAVNKIDKADADADRVLTQLLEHGLNPEEWGGDTLVSKVSALKKENLDSVLDNILLVSELLDLKADPKVPAEGIIIEAKLDKKQGPLATALVQNGTLNIGDNIMIGPVGGRVRALIDDQGNRIKTAGPSTPVKILGLGSVPNAGDTLKVITNDKAFKQMLSSERDRERANRLERRQIMPGLRAPLEGEEIEEQYIHFIVKADTQGATEAVNDALSALSHDEIKVKIIHSGTGDISEADVMLASASHAIIIAFNVYEDQNAGLAAEKAHVNIRKYDVIYHIAEEVEKIMLGQLSPESIETEIGKAEVRELFTAGKTVIAGSMVTEGKILRNATVRVLRDDKEIHKGNVANIKRFKEDAKEVASGFECGITLHNFNGFESGDTMTFFITEEKARTSESIKRTNTPV